MSLYTYSLMYIGRHKRVNLLNYVPYSKTMAIELLSNEFNWKYYGGKHFESRFTKFFQSYYLPKKFGFSKKRAHISSLIVGGELSRDQALIEMDDESAYPESKMLDDLEYILKKLDITNEEWEEIMKAPNKTEDDYKNSKKMIRRLQKIKHIIKS